MFSWSECFPSTPKYQQYDYQDFDWVYYSKDFGRMLLFSGLLSGDLD